MPKLPNHSNPAFPANLILGNEMMLAMQALTEPFRQINEAMERMVEPIRQAQAAMERMILPIKIIQDTLNTSMLPLVRAMDAYAESHLHMMESISLSGLNDITRVSFGVFPKSFIDADVIDGEITEEEKSPPRPLMQQVIAVPPSRTLVPVSPTTTGYQTRSVMGLKEISGRSFQFKRKTLKKLSYRNCEGRLLSLFLANQHLFVSDDVIRDKLHIPDGRSFSWALRNLKRKLRTNGLSGIIERRWNPDGYILIDIYYLQ